MAGNNIQRWLSLACTQGAADGFIQSSVATDIIPENGLVYKVLGIEIQISSAIQTIAADAALYWSFSRDTKTALCPLSDPDCMVMDGLAFGLVTSGAFVTPVSKRYTDLIGLYIVEPTVYMQVSSSATAIVNIINARIYYEEVKMSEVEILRILNNT